MQERGLGELVQRFLEADGFTIVTQSSTRVEAERQGGREGQDRRTVWIAGGEPGVTMDERALLAELAACRPAKVASDPTRQAFLLVPSLTGLSTLFRETAARLGVGIRVPVQFFDTPYKADGDSAFGTGKGASARSTISDYLRANDRELALRVPQPFVAMSALGEGAGGFKTGADLLPHLLADLLAASEGPRLTLVIGNAGAGKSRLFAAVFAALHRHFMNEKRSQRPASRPVLFLPEHIRNSQVRSMDGLLAAVAETDAAAATRPQMMRFLNRAGFTIWMFDGLDEFFSGESDFVAALDSALADDSKARIVVCSRDSLIASSSALRDLVERHIGTGKVRLYELSRWERPSQRALAWVRRAGRLPPEQSAVDPQTVRAFLARLDASPELAELATLPYYCDLLLETGAVGGKGPVDELELLAQAVDGLIDREAGKLASGELGFGWDVFSGAESFSDAAELVEAWGTDAFAAASDRAAIQRALQAIGRERLVELIEVIAHRMRMQEAYPAETGSLPVSEIEQLAAVYLDVGLYPDLEPRVLLAIVQMAFFGQGGQAGEVRFSHEIVADFLAGRHALRMILARPESADALGQALGVRRDLSRSVALRVLVRGLLEHPDVADAAGAHVTAGRLREQYRENGQQLSQALAEVRT